MNGCQILRLASAMLWAESALRTFDKHEATRPPELRQAVLSARFALDDMRLLRHDLDESDRAQLDTYLNDVRTAVAGRAQQQDVTLHLVPSAGDGRSPAEGAPA